LSVEGIAKVDGMNVKEYRKRCEAGVKKAAKTKSADAVANTQALLADSASDSKARVSAIENAQIDAENIDSLADQYLQTLRNRKETVAVRMAALDALKAADFLGPRFDPYRAQYLQALRELANERSSTLRESALEMLAIHKDPYAQEALLRGLKDAKAALVSPAKAIQLLGYDDHAEVFATVRSLFQSASDTAKEEALRLLASDPGSERLFSKLLKDKTQRSMIRRLSAVGLQNLNAAAFEKAARKIVMDGEDYNEIRASSLAALTTAEAPDQADDKFAAQVSEIQTRSTNLRSSVKRFLRAKLK
jgi:hypothetical protein